MKKTEFLAILEDTAETLRCLTDSKGQEYAGSDDQLANFKRLGNALGLPAEAILLVYLTKHMDSIQSYVRALTSDNLKHAPSLSEPITGRIDDAILYLILLKAIIIESV